MANIIQQLEDLKEWSQNPERYERRMNFRNGQLVDHGPGRQGYNGQTDYQRKWYQENKERIVAKKKAEYAKLPIEKRRETWGKKQLPEARAKTYKKRILTRTPLSKVDQSVLKNFELNFKYSKHINEIIKEHGRLRPNPETMSDLMEIRFETDPEFKKLWGDKPFTSGKNLSPSSFKHAYNRAMAGTKRVTGDNFKQALTALFEKELAGTGTSVDDFIANDFKLTDTFMADQADSPKAKYQRRYREIMKGKTGWTLGGKGSQVWFADPKQKGATATTNLNKKLKINGQGPLGFVRSHYFGNIQAQKLYNLGLLDEDAAKNFKERYTYKPRYINDLQSMTYDRDVYRALRNFNNHKDNSKLATEINEAATKAKRLGLDVDELKLNTETGKFNFLDKKRVLQTGGDRETRYLVKTAMNEIANVQSMTDKELSGDMTKNINKDYGKRAEKIINQVKKGSTQFYPETPKWAQRLIPKATKISVPAGSSRVASVAGVLDDALKTKTAKKIGSLIKKTGAPFEAGFIVTDYYNNLSRGMKPEEAWQTALSNATFGIYEGGGRSREKELAELAQTQGYKDWQVDSLKTMMSYRKLKKELQSEKFKLKQLIAEQESGVTSVTGEDVAGAIEQQKDLISKMEQGLEDTGKAYYEGIPEGKDFNTGKMFDDLLGYKARDEYNRTVEDRKHRVNPDMGEIGSPLWESLSDWRTFLPQNLMETTQATQPVVRNLRKLPGILGEMWDPTSEQAMLSAMTPEEREERALRLNVKKQTYDPMHQTSTMTYDQMDPYYADFGYMYADGGIAGIRRPGAVPPESGPMPQGGGLSSQYNRVKKLTE